MLRQLIQPSLAWFLSMEPVVL